MDCRSGVLVCPTVFSLLAFANLITFLTYSTKTNSLKSPVLASNITLKCRCLKIVPSLLVLPFDEKGNFEIYFQVSKNEFYIRIK